MTPRLKEKFFKETSPALMQKFGLKNKMQVPRLEKIVINMGLGIAVAEPKVVDSAVEELSRITGQKPIVTRAKKAISNFKIRRGLPIGCKVTLRGDRMYEFFDRLCNIALPRVRDFKGVPKKGFDPKGNYTLGIKEHGVFPEVDLDKIDRTLGMNVTFVTTAKNVEQSQELLGLLGMPFRKN